MLDAEQSQVRAFWYPEVAVMRGEVFLGPKRHGPDRKNQVDHQAHVWGELIRHYLKIELFRARERKQDIRQDIDPRSLSIRGWN